MLLFFFFACYFGSNLNQHNRCKHITCMKMRLNKISFPVQIKFRATTNTTTEPVDFTDELRFLYSKPDGKFTSHISSLPPLFRALNVAGLTQIHLWNSFDRVLPLPVEALFHLWKEDYSQIPAPVLNKRSWWWQIRLWVFLLGKRRGTSEV